MRSRWFGLAVAALAAVHVVSARRSNASLHIGAVMRWPNIDALLVTVTVPSGYQLAQLAVADIPELIERLRGWYSDIEVGAESCHLREASPGGTHAVTAP